MRHLLAAAAMLAAAGPAHAVTFVNALTVAGDTTDLTTEASNAKNRLGGFGSDLVYDAASDLYYGLTDRGPGGGVVEYAPRIQAFKLTTDSATGAISDFQLQNTIVFTQADGSTFTGLNPTLANGNPAVLGASFDPEGLTLTRNGTFLVSDEYGPSVYEFGLDGKLIRQFQVPANLVPRQANGAVNYTDDRGTVATGRQDNRGFEGLTVSPDGKTAYAILQDPLFQEGANNDGRRSRNVRIVRYDTATGESTGQFIYQLESVDTLNAQVPGNSFSATNQGRSIGNSAILALPNGKLLVLERDNRGFGSDPSVDIPVAEKAIYLIDLAGADDVSGLDLTGTNTLPAGIDAVVKSATPFLDIRAALTAAGLPIPEKIEGMTVGEWLDDGSLQFNLITDNDYSVTQTGSGEQFNVCRAGPGSPGVQVGLNEACPTGTSLVPTFIYSFKLSAAEAAQLGYVQAAVPEPASWAMMIAGFGLVGGALRRRRGAAAFA
jgi:hypothetical protein